MPIIASLQRMDRGTHFRAYALRAQDMIDPFLGVDHARMSGPTFPPHPHAGFSAVSYLFLDSETGINNRDSIGTQNLIRPGGLHWTTAGRGIVHEEVPAQNGKTVHSLQIFIDLPSELKDVDPFPLILEPEDIPTVQLPGVSVRVPAGSFAGVRSPMKPPTDVTILDISLQAGAELVAPIEAGHVAFVMPIFGTATVDGHDLSLNNLDLPIFIAQETPRRLSIKAPHHSAKVMLFSGRPLQPSAI